MADYVLEFRVWLPRPREEVFPFFADPRNLARLDPPRLGVQLLSPPPTPLAAGTVFDFRIRWLGIPLRWRVLIREYDPPYRFVDVHRRRAPPGAGARQNHRLLGRPALRQEPAPVGGPAADRRGRAPLQEGPADHGDHRGLRPLHLPDQPRDSRRGRVAAGGGRLRRRAGAR